MHGFSLIVLFWLVQRMGFCLQQILYIPWGKYFDVEQTELLNDMHDST